MKGIAYFFTLAIFLSCNHKEDNSKWELEFTCENNKKINLSSFENFIKDEYKHEKGFSFDLDSSFIPSKVIVNIQNSDTFYCNNIFDDSLQFKRMHYFDLYSIRNKNEIEFEKEIKNHLFEDINIVDFYSLDSIYDSKEMNINASFIFKTAKGIKKIKTSNILSKNYPALPKDLSTLIYRIKIAIMSTNSVAITK